MSDDSASRSNYKVIDLFSGAGGFSLGFAEAGAPVALGSDMWRPAADTYRRNLTDHPFLEADALDLTPSALGEAAALGSEPLVMVGGPPCQGFSSAGARRRADSRNSLVGAYSLLGAQLLPDVFVFENVEGFLTAGAGSSVVDLLDPLIEAGYQVALHKLNVANYGVPQLRKRVIVIAALGRRPAELVPTHRAFGAPGVSRVGKSLPAARTVDDALSGLPSPAAAAPGLPSGHYWADKEGLDKLRMAALRPGQTMRDLPIELQHTSYLRRANRRVADGTATEKRGGAPAGLRRLIGSEPSKAITGAASREFVHPHTPRRLTLRECARIQTFPDWFEFVGSRADCNTMVGNAVPPAFARAVAQAVAETLEQPKSQDARGRLLRFQPTVSDGMSPALRAVTQLVASRYGSRTVEAADQELLWA